MFDTVIGLEIHIQLKTKTKLFCSCSTEFSTTPNKNICPVCTGHLGALPVLNEQALDYAIKAGLALNCKINKRSMFDRKNYFYADLPKGYQISQFYHPYAEKGYLDISNKRIGITRIHIEEDAGKLIHNEMTQESYVDYNRSSVPLIEVVSDPDLSSSEEVVEFLTKLKNIIKYTEVSDVSMELGSLRCDANVSIKLQNAIELGTRVEIKNLNSFKAVAKAIEYEAERQKKIILEGGTINCETRLWDDSRQVTKCMRDKEGAADYRYFPDPDLLPCEILDERIDRISQELPELPQEKVDRFVKEYHLPEYDSKVLSSSRALADYFEEVVSHCGSAKASSNWIMTDILRVFGDENITISASHLGKMIKMIEDNLISGKIAKEVFLELSKNDRDPMDIVNEKGLIQISNRDDIERLVDNVLESNPQSIVDFKEGKLKVIGFLIGQIMRESKGKANPEISNEILMAKLNSHKG